MIDLIFFAVVHHVNSLLVHEFGHGVFFWLVKGYWPSYELYKRNGFLSVHLTEPVDGTFWQRFSVYVAGPLFGILFLFLVSLFHSWWFLGLIPLHVYLSRWDLLFLARIVYKRIDFLRV